MIKTIITSTLSLLLFIAIPWNITSNIIQGNPIFNNQNDQEEQLKLNNGKRWKANPETTTGVNNMIKKMEVFSSSKNVKTQKNYNELSKGLRAEMNLIFDNCSMKGKAHDNLHTFLVPIFGYLKQLEGSELNNCKNGFTELNQQLKKYAIYFE